jgi:hypothetical protein
VRRGSRKVGKQEMYTEIGAQELLRSHHHWCQVSEYDYFRVLCKKANSIEIAVLNVKEKCTLPTTVDLDITR